MNDFVELTTVIDVMLPLTELGIERFFEFTVEFSLLVILAIVEVEDFHRFVCAAIVLLPL